MRINRGIAAGLAVLLGICAFVNLRTHEFGNEQAANDRQTVDCLTSQLTRSEKQRIAQFAAAHDREALHVAYMGIFPRCVVRRDQWARSDLLLMNARQVLKYDPEFKRMVAAGSLTTTQR